MNVGTLTITPARANSHGSDLWAISVVYWLSCSSCLRLKSKVQNISAQSGDLACETNASPRDCTRDCTRDSKILILTLGKL